MITGGIWTYLIRVNLLNFRSEILQQLLTKNKNWRLTKTSKGIASFSRCSAMLEFSYGDYLWHQEKKLIYWKHCNVSESSSLVICKRYSMAQSIAGTENRLVINPSYASVPFETYCAICYHWYNLKNAKNTYEGLLLLVISLQLY